LNIGIIGAGQVGGVLAFHFVKLGHNVSIANSRGAESLATLSAKLSVAASSVNDVVMNKNIIVLAIPTIAIPNLPDKLFLNLPNNTILIDTTNYHPKLRDGHIVAIDQGKLESQWVSEQIGRPVIKAFNTIFASNLREKAQTEEKTKRVALPVSSDSVEAKMTLINLINNMGFDAIDVGTLADSWRQQTGAPCYCKDLNTSSLRHALAQADPTQIAVYRENEEMRIKRDLFAQK